MLAKVRRHPLYVAIFILLIGVPQFHALLQQFHFGFRPFVQNPTRVSYSWDMFSNKVDRCLVNFAVPLSVGPLNFSSLRDIGLAFEWDIIFDRVEDYTAVTRALCQASSHQTNSAKLHCFTSQGQELEDEIPCN